MLKRETRVLGLSSTTIRRGTVVLIVVFRGSLWLDGVTAAVTDTSDQNFNLKVSDLIKGSKQFSQLHVILISPRLIRAHQEMSIHDLAETVKLPVIAIDALQRGSKSRRKYTNHFDISVRGKNVSVSAEGVERDEAERLYRISCSPYDKIPEPVRVADLLAQELNRTMLKKETQP